MDAVELLHAVKIKRNSMHSFIQKVVYHLPPSVMGSLNVPVPLILTAATWKEYSVFEVRSLMILSIVLTDLYCWTSLPAPWVAKYLTV